MHRVFVVIYLLFCTSVAYANFQTQNGPYSIKIESINNLEFYKSTEIMPNKILIARVGGKKISGLIDHKWLKADLLDSAVCKEVENKFFNNIKVESTEAKSGSNTICYIQQKDIRLGTQKIAFIIGKQKVGFLLRPVLSVQFLSTEDTKIFLTEVAGAVKYE